MATADALSSPSRFPVMPWPSLLLSVSYAPGGGLVPVCVIVLRSGRILPRQPNQ